MRLLKIKNICYNVLTNGDCSSFGRVSGCGSEGSGFDPRQSPQVNYILRYIFLEDL